ncbi:phosphoenolpyruvate phosphomutase family protein, partial [Vibrio parahaemolyticus V-223/04]
VLAAHSTSLAPLSKWKKRALQRCTWKTKLHKNVVVIVRTKRL